MGSGKDPEERGRDGMGRRAFLQAAAGAGLALAAAPGLTGCDRSGRLGLPKHLKEMTPAEIEELLASLEARYREQTGRDFEVGADPALPGVTFGYGLDLSRCIGCRRCVYACVEENNLSRDPQIHWITVLEMEQRKGVDLHHSDRYYDPDEVPREDHFYMPVACMQCANPPCTKVCPVKATWSEPDGIVVVDPDWCIGCRYCMAACPYEARRFNFSTPKVPKEEINPNQGYLSNRIRPRGVVEKCTYCLHRTRKGQNPACLEACPTGARIFGNMLDPNSEISYVLKNKRVYILKEEAGTIPRFFYYFDK